MRNHNRSFTYGQRRTHVRAFFFTALFKVSQGNSEAHTIWKIHIRKVDLPVACIEPTADRILHEFESAFLNGESLKVYKALYIVGGVLVNVM